MNAAQKALWSGSWKSVVGVVTGALLTNLADSPYPIFTSGAWWKHLAIACGILILTTEGRYWNQWSSSGNPRPLPDAIQDAKDSAKQTEEAIAKVQEIAPKP